VRPARSIAATLASAGFLAAAGCAAWRGVAAPAERSAPAAMPATASMAALERAVLDRVNEHRRARGLPALTFDARIAAEARRHSQAMAAGTRPGGHAGFDDRLAAIRRVMPVRESAENVAYNKGHARPASEAVRGWLGSRGHRSNIEGPWSTTGVGVARNAAGEFYFTQIFVRQ
jgi:uncharacterized protein YkwD